jgi:hypothetical protein
MLSLNVIERMSIAAFVFQLIPGDSVTLVNWELRHRILDFAIGPIFRVPGTSIAQTFRTLN